MLIAQYSKPYWNQMSVYHVTLSFLSKSLKVSCGLRGLPEVASAPLSWARSLVQMVDVWESHGVLYLVNTGELLTLTSQHWPWDCLLCHHVYPACCCLDLLNNWINVSENNKNGWSLMVKCVHHHSLSTYNFPICIILPLILMRMINNTSFIILNLWVYIYIYIYICL